MAEQRRGTGKVRPAKAPRDALAAHAPWIPVTCDPADVTALQALARGEADPGMQRRALDFVIRLSRNDGALYFPGEDGRRDTDFALGRAFVGEQVVALLKLNLRRANSEQG